MASYIKSKVQQSLSFLLVLVIAFSVFSGVLFLNPSPSYAYSRDLSSVDYSGRNLSGENFSNANLSGADLRGANLGRANLSGANLRGANLNYAWLIGAMADSRTIFPEGFNAVGARVMILP
ncbi:MAG: pentapeptide repeat-containing protein [Cuspidothrix sp.]